MLSDLGIPDIFHLIRNVADANRQPQLLARIAEAKAPE
jgi:hypothetical protein